MKTVPSLDSRVQCLIFVTLALVLTSISSCKLKSDLNAVTGLSPNINLKSGEQDSESPVNHEPLATENLRIANASTILARKQVPVLCYHHIKNWSATTSARAKDYIVPVETFKEQLKMLADSGYQTILPDELYNYLAFNAPLPPKPVMLTFDDTDLEQYTIALPEMKKYGFKGVFFIMTVSINRPNYMSKEQIKSLSDEGNEIGSHTWDHRNVKLYREEDWATQIDKPTKQLSAITGKQVKYFAYPFGLWNPQAIPELKKRGFKAAFQLSIARDQQDPLHTIRRIIVPGYWGASSLDKCMKKSFL